MKTLDEVIKANECCNNDNRCEDCPYNGLGVCVLEREIDALYYLKEYRDYRTLKEGIEKQKQKLLNPPLTWEELKSMGGKPVWIESSEDIVKYIGWTIIRKIWDDRASFIIGDMDGDFFVEEITCLKCTYDKTWQVYRKEHYDN